MPLQAARSLPRAASRPNNPPHAFLAARSLPGACSYHLRRPERASIRLSSIPSWAASPSRRSVSTRPSRRRRAAAEHSVARRLSRQLTDLQERTRRSGYAPGGNALTRRHGSISLLLIVALLRWHSQHRSISVAADGRSLLDQRTEITWSGKSSVLSSRFDRRKSLTRLSSSSPGFDPG